MCLTLEKYSGVCCAVIMAIGRSRDTSDALPNPIGMNQEDSTLEMLFYNIIKNQMRLLPEQ